SRAFRSSSRSKARMSPASSVGTAGIRVPLREEGTPRPVGKKCDEDDERRREVIGQGNRPLILEVDEEKPAEPCRDAHGRWGAAEDPSPPSAEEQPAADRDLQGDRDHDPPERV